MDMAHVSAHTGAHRRELAYSPADLVLMFFIFSFFGWLYEIGLTFFQTGLLVNRGAFHGPWLPIYGVAGILMAEGLHELKNHPLHLFSMCVTLSAIVEYLASVLLEALFGMRWWDYSNLPFNLGGRICLPILLGFASVGFLLTRYIAPFVQGRLSHVSPRAKSVCCLILCALLIIDSLLTLSNPNMGIGVTI